MTTLPDGIRSLEKTLHEVSGALGLAAYVLVEDPGQLAGQLVGRLRGTSSAPVARLIDQPRGNDGPWLKPLFASLSSPTGALQRIMTGHESDVSCLAIEPSGRRMISGSGDSTVRVWDLSTGSEVWTLTGHIGPVSDVTVSAHGGRCFSASLDGSLREWDLDSGEQQSILGGHPGGITKCVALPDGERVASGGNDGVVRIWDAASKTETAAVSIGSKIYELVATLDGASIIVGCYDGRMMLWDGVSEPLSLKGTSKLSPDGFPEDYVNEIAISPDGRTALAASGQHKVSFWDLEEGRRTQEVELKTSSLTITPDGSHFVTCSNERRVLDVWDMQAGTHVTSLGSGTGEVLDLAMTPDGKHVLTASFDGAIRLWRFSTAAEGSTALESRSLVVDGTASPDGTYVITGADDGRIEVWETPFGQRRSAWIAHQAAVYALEITPDSNSVVSGSADGTLGVWDIASGRESFRLEHGNSVTTLSVSANGQRLASGQVDGTARVFHLPSGTLEAEYHMGRPNLTGVLMSPSGDVLIASAAGLGADSAVTSIWAHAPNRKTHPFELGDAIKMFPYTGAICFMPDGRHFASSADGVLRLSSADNWADVAVWPAHAGRISAVIATPDGRALISCSGSDEAVVRVWDLKGRLLAEFTGHAQDVLRSDESGLALVRGISALAVTPDGQYAVSCSADRSVRVWEIDTGRQIAMFTGERGLNWCAVAGEGGAVAVGETLGRLHILSLTGASRGSPVGTASDGGTAHGQLWRIGSRHKR